MSFSPFQAMLRTAEGRLDSGLLAWVAAVARGSVKTTKGTPVRLPDEARDDLVSDLVVKLLEDAPAIVARWVTTNPEFGRIGAEDGPSPVLERADRMVRAYVSRSLANRFLDREKTRKRRRQANEGLRVALEEIEVRRQRSGGATQEAEEAARDVYAAATEVLDAAIDRLAATRDADPASLRESLEQMIQLSQGASMAEIAAAEASKEGDDHPDAATSRRLRDRLLRRHSRTRQYLADALDELEAESTFEPEKLGLARKVLEAVLIRRRPMKGPPGVPPGEESSK